ncbi:MAG: FAD-binding protein [Rhodobacteraceae bacterium]|nr:FAD-binding protein [Paracoccaceae bacterium]
MTWKSTGISRRMVLGGLVSLTVPRPPLARAGVKPPLIGAASSFTTDELVLRRFSRDWGGMVRRRPAAVARPATVEDVQGILRWANRNRCPVAVRGAGHSQGGQSLTSGGIVLDMRKLNSIGPAAHGDLDVAGGARWREVVNVAAPKGHVPRVLTDYLGLSVGGTLSAGGFGSTSHEYGAQVDNVRELEVVTGAGHVVTCSAEQDGDLFDAVRGGVGQYGVVVRARIAMRPLPPKGRLYRLSYGDVSTALADLRRCVEYGVFQHAWIHVLPGRGRAGEYGSRWARPRCLMGLAQEGDDRDDETGKLSAFRHDEIIANVANIPSEEIGRYEPPRWDRWMAHPWRDWLLPASRAARAVNKALELLPEELPPEVPGLRSVAALWTFPVDRFTAPAFIIPRTERYFTGFSFLSRMVGTPAAVRRMREILEEMDRLIIASGGKAYLSGCPDYDTARWAQHFGPLWQQVRFWKARYDPGAILGPGYIAFGSTN